MSPPLRSLLWFLSVSQRPSSLPICLFFLQPLKLLGQGCLFPYLSPHFVTSFRASIGAGSLAVLPSSAGFCIQRVSTEWRKQTQPWICSQVRQNPFFPKTAHEILDQKRFCSCHGQNRLVSGRCWGARPFTEQREQESARAGDIILPQSNNRFWIAHALGISLPKQLQVVTAVTLDLAPSTCEGEAITHQCWYQAGSLFFSFILFLSISGTLGLNECLLVRVCVHAWVCVHSLAQLCLTLGNPMDCSPPGSSVYEIFLARILEWVAISFSRGASWPRDWTHITCIAVRFFTNEPPGKLSSWVGPHKTLPWEMNT